MPAIFGRTGSSNSLQENTGEEMGRKKYLVHRIRFFKNFKILSALGDFFDK